MLLISTEAQLVSVIHCLCTLPASTVVFRLLLLLLEDLTTYLYSDLFLSSCFFRTLVISSSKFFYKALLLLYQEIMFSHMPCEAISQEICIITFSCYHISQTPSEVLTDVIKAVQNHDLIGQILMGHKCWISSSSG